MKGLIMNATQELTQLVARNNGITFKTVRFNGVEFKQGTARVHVTDKGDYGYVEIVGQQHAGHEILVKHMGAFRGYEPDLREYYEKEANKIVKMLNS
jgi:hypothetical protein